MSNPEQIKTDVFSLMTDTRKWHAQREYKGVSREQFESEMQNKYNYLYTNSSTLFGRCIAGDLNMEQFNFMLDMLKKVNAGKDYQTVSQEVGQKLVDIYVKPLIKE